ncbi:MAG TPA: type IX secretion system membrane protein PorP/SprF [Bacteroidales bacterium]|nr:type IX secretion system membrane protein PorP/SprF [Bacteroidales bacterium]HPS16014.1 type IX secretion system membrane protein PorP/SprF [Bacteroidales bacterium]
MKKNITFLFFFLASVVIYAQQEVQVSHNMFNNMGINPAYAGMNDGICATAIVRQQWMGFEDAQGYKGAPQTYLLSIDGAVHPLHGGLGLNVMQDQLGFEKNLDVKLSYSYKLAAGPGILGIGAQIGFWNKKYDFTKFLPIDINDPKLLGGGEEGNMATDFAFGVFYQIPSKLYFGLSSSQLSQAEISYTTSLAAPTLSRHYYVSAGYYYPIPSNPSLELDPSILIKSDLASTQFDVNALLKFNNTFWGGISWRAQDAIVALIGYQRNFNFGTLRLGYSYDFTTSALNNYSSGSHEIMLGYCFKITKAENHESYDNVRFL